MNSKIDRGMKKYYYLYETKNLINGKFYIGVRGTNKDPESDDYMGSGTLIKKAIKKYGKINFSKSIIELFQTPEEMIQREREIVNLEFVKRKDTYNLEIGGSGGKIWTDDMKNSMSQTKKGSVPWNKGKKNIYSAESCNKISNSLKGKLTGDKNPMFGIDPRILMSEENVKQMNEKISKSLTGKVRSDESKRKYSEAASKRKWIVHISGQISHLKENDERMKSGEWKLGKKW